MDNEINPLKGFNSEKDILINYDFAKLWEARKPQKDWRFIFSTVHNFNRFTVWENVNTFQRIYFQELE